MHYMTLKGLEYELDKVGTGKKYTKWYNTKMNNLIISIPTDSPDSTFNAISDAPYFRLMEYLNHHRNVVVLWSQVEGTTSDYIIFPMKNASDVFKYKKMKPLTAQKELLKMLDEWGWTCKYMILEDGVSKHFTDDDIYSGQLWKLEYTGKKGIYGAPLVTPVKYEI